jgi:hypothetical protein
MSRTAPTCANVERLRADYEGLRQWFITLYDTTQTLHRDTRQLRHKPSGIAATESILKWHLLPALGAKRLDEITNGQVQRLKLALVHRSPKTVNNVFAPVTFRPPH